MRALWSFLAAIGILIAVCVLLEAAWLAYDWCCWRAEERERRR